MNKNHYLSAIVLIVFAIMAFACVVARPAQQEEVRRNSSKNQPTYRKAT